MHRPVEVRVPMVRPAQFRHRGPADGYPCLRVAMGKARTLGP